MKQHAKHGAALAALALLLAVPAGAFSATLASQEPGTDTAGPCSAPEPHCMQEAPGSASGQQVISQLQRALAARDYYQGLVDGVAGEQTAQAIFLFQMDCELPLTGSLNARILKLLHIPSPAWLTE